MLVFLEGDSLAAMFVRDRRGGPVTSPERMNNIPLEN
jgi:hypothetical protein